MSHQIDDDSVEQANSQSGQEEHVPKATSSGSGVVANRRTGTINKWFENKKFGFILPDGSDQELFFHISDVAGLVPAQGFVVSFLLVMDPARNRFRAGGVRPPESVGNQCPGTQPIGNTGDTESTGYVTDHWLWPTSNIGGPESSSVTAFPQCGGPWQPGSMYQPAAAPSWAAEVGPDGFPVLSPPLLVVEYWYAMVHLRNLRDTDTRCSWVYRSQDLDEAHRYSESVTTRMDRQLAIRYVESCVDLLSDRVIWSRGQLADWDHWAYACSSAGDHNGVTLAESWCAFHNERIRWAMKDIALADTVRIELTQR